MPNSGLENAKYAMDIVQSTATVIALVVGGIWTYRLFIQQRQEQPRLKIEHKISQRRLLSGETLLSVDELLSNPGSTLVALHSSETRIIQMLPLPTGLTGTDLTDQHELPDIVDKPEKWPVLRDTRRRFPDGDRLLEPGEEDQLHAEFVLPARIQVVCVATHVENPRNTKLGWQRITIFDINPPVLKKDVQKTVKTTPVANHSPSQP
ncbi:MAG: hypothetical protein JOZ32_01085 [Bryobacterales bacterium]|nr:hypothetical protein [Bryobacterales bacterium]